VELGLEGGCVMGPGEVSGKTGKITWKPNEDVETEICILCCAVITDKGHNPYPLSSHGKCCINCNAKVSQVRLSEYE